MKLVSRIYREAVTFLFCIGYMIDFCGDIMYYRRPCIERIFFYDFFVRERFRNSPSRDECLYLGWGDGGGHIFGNKRDI